MAADDNVGLILAGGGARGAYEAGVLSTLLPALEARGESPSVIVGTSIGAISCAFVAGNTHLGVEATGAAALNRWREVSRGHVMSSLVGGLPLTTLRYLGEALGVPGVRVQSLVDTAPLIETLDAWLDWGQIHANVRSGAIDSAAVVATDARDGRSVVFVDTNAKPPADDERLRYVKTPLRNEHIRASSAIPIVFPPIEIRSPAAARGWYYDGGTRMNTPIKPAIDQGADRVVVIALDSVEAPPPSKPAASGSPPDFGDAALHLLQGALVDPLVEDVRRLAQVNRLIDQGADTAHRPIPYIFIAPEHSATIGEIAREVYDEYYSGLKRLRNPDIAAMTRLLGGSGVSQGALISLLFFERPFVERLIVLGQQDARRWLDQATGPDAPWHHGPLETRPGRVEAAAPRTRRQATKRPAPV